MLVLLPWKCAPSLYSRGFDCRITSNLTFRGPCIVIYSYNKSQRAALFLDFILVKNSSSCLMCAIMFLNHAYVLFIYTLIEFFTKI